MSPITTKLGLLTLVSAVAAVPQYGGYGEGHGGHGHGGHHSHLHSSGYRSGASAQSSAASAPYGSAPHGSAPYSSAVSATGSAPYGYGNGTGIAGPTGTGTGFYGATSTGSVPSYAPSPVGPGSASSYVSAHSAVGVSSAASEACSASEAVTSTVVNTVYVTVTGAAGYSSSAEVSAVGASSSAVAESSPVSAYSSAVAESGNSSASAYSSASSEVSAVGASSRARASQVSTSEVASSSSSLVAYSAVGANRGHHPHSYTHSAHSTARSSASAQSSASALSSYAASSASVASSSVVSAESSSSSAVASGTSAYAVSSTSSAVVAPTTSSSVVAATSSSLSAYQPSTTAAASSSVQTTAAAATTTAAASSSLSAYSSATGSCTASPSYTGSYSSAAKRGCAYNDASMCDLFDSSEVTWAYNWGSSTSGLSSSLNYVPQLWGTATGFTSGWSDNAKAAISAGSTHLMSFNEPDLPAQANLSPADAATAYRTYMQPFAGTDVKLGAPAVTNGGGGTGLDWLSAFLDECCDCQIDFVAIHWYDSCENTAYFQEQVKNATDVAGGRPVWLTEFGTTDGDDTQISTFLESVMPWLDEQDYVERYSYFMASDGLLVSGTELSGYGSTFVTYTS